MTVTEPRGPVDLRCDICPEIATWGLIGETGDYLLCDEHHDVLPPEHARAYHRLAY